MDIDPQQLAALASELKVRFLDQEPRQTVQVEGFAPFYFPNTPQDYSERLPGGSCAEAIRKDYADTDHPYESLVTALFIWLQRLRPQLSMIDVGALWGETSFVAASVFERPHIHMFEMNPFVSEVLRRTADLNRHLNAEFHVQNALVSKFDGLETVTFRYYTARYGDNEGGINLSPMKVFGENLKSKIRKIMRRPTRGEYVKKQMPIATIDTYCRENNFAPNLIKVDVEGSEFDVLSGARTVLSQHHPLLLVEFHAADAANYIQKPNRDLLRMAEGFGYRCLWTDHRVHLAPLYNINSGTDLNVETNGLAILY